MRVTSDIHIFIIYLNILPSLYPTRSITPQTVLIDQMILKIKSIIIFFNTIVPVAIRGIEFSSIYIELLLKFLAIVRFLLRAKLRQ